MCKHVKNTLTQYYINIQADDERYFVCPESVVFTSSEIGCEPTESRSFIQCVQTNKFALLMMSKVIQIMKLI